MAVQDSVSGEIGVWDIPSGKRLCKVPRKGTVAFAFDQKTFATGGKSEVDLWNTYTGEQLATLNIPESRRQALAGGALMGYAGAFSNDGKTIAIDGDWTVHADGVQTVHEGATVHLWDIATQTHITTLQGHDTVCQLAFSPDDTILAAGDVGGVIRLWELSTGRHITTFKGHKTYVSVLVFSPDGKTLASAGGGVGAANNLGGAILLWNVPSK